MRIFRITIVFWIVTSFNFCYNQISTSTTLGVACTFPYFQRDYKNHYSKYSELKNIPGIGVKLKEEIILFPKLSARIGFELIGSKVYFEKGAGTGFNAISSNYDEQIYIHKLTIYELHIPIEVKYDFLKVGSTYVYGTLGLAYRKVVFSKGKLFSLNNDLMYSDNVKIASVSYDENFKEKLSNKFSPKASLGWDYHEANNRFGFFCELEYSFLSGYYQYSGSKKKFWYNDEGIFNNHLIEVVIGVRFLQYKR